MPMLPDGPHGRTSELEQHKLRGTTEETQTQPQSCPSKWETEARCTHNLCFPLSI